MSHGYLDSHDGARTVGIHTPPVAASLAELRTADNHAQLLCNRQETNACNDKEPEVLGSH
jgi:hypothetical protein